MDHSFAVGWNALYLVHGVGQGCAYWHLLSIFIIIVSNGKALGDIFKNKGLVVVGFFFFGKLPLVTERRWAAVT